MNIDKCEENCVKKSKKVKTIRILLLFFGIFNNSTAFISQQNPIGQRIQSLWNVLNILSHELSQKFATNSKKNCKIRKFVATENPYSLGEPILSVLQGESLWRCTPLSPTLKRLFSFSRGNFRKSLSI